MAAITTITIAISITSSSTKIYGSQSDALKKREGRQSWDEGEVEQNGTKALTDSSSPDKTVKCPAPASQSSSVSVAPFLSVSFCL